MVSVRFTVNGKSKVKQFDTLIKAKIFMSNLKGARRIDYVSSK